MGSLYSTHGPPSTGATPNSPIGFIKTLTYNYWVKTVDNPPVSGTVNYATRLVPVPPGDKVVRYDVRSDIGSSTIDYWVNSIDCVLF